MTPGLPGLPGPALFPCFPALFMLISLNDACPFSCIHLISLGPQLSTARSHAGNICFCFACFYLVSPARSCWLLLVFLICDSGSTCVSNQEGREDCTTNCKHSQQTLARHGLRLEQWLVTRGQPVEYRSVISLIRLRVVVCKQPTSISIMGLDTLNMLILILTGVQEFSEQNAGNASPDFWWKGTDHQKKLREVCRRY